MLTKVHRAELLEVNDQAGDNGCVLFAEPEDYYFSIGGGVHMGESAEKTVKREMLEETCVVYAERRNLKAIV